MTIIINCKEAQPVNQFISQQNYKEEKEQGKENILIKVVIHPMLITYVVWKLCCKICIYVYCTKEPLSCYAYTYACRHMYTHGVTHAHMCAHVYTRMHVQTNMLTSIYTRVCTQIHTHINCFITS